MTQTPAQSPLSPTAADLQRVQATATALRVALDNLASRVDAEVAYGDEWPEYEAACEEVEKATAQAPLPVTGSLPEMLLAALERTAQTIESIQRGEVDSDRGDDLVALAETLKDIRQATARGRVEIESGAHTQGPWACVKPLWTDPGCTRHVVDAKGYLIARIPLANAVQSEVEAIANGELIAQAPVHRDIARQLAKALEETRSELQTTRAELHEKGVRLSCERTNTTSAALLHAGKVLDAAKAMCS